MARLEAWEGKNPGGVRVLLANPRWEGRFVKFLELSGVGRVMADGTDEDGARAARMDEWAHGTRRREQPRGVRVDLAFHFISFLFLLLGRLVQSAQRVYRPRVGYWFPSLVLFVLSLRYIL
jgi:hypothetical protein